jgi:hypothetical protein
MLEGLAGLLKEGVIGRLEGVNIASRPEVAQGLGVRSVPWVRIGAFEFEGLLTLGELRSWAQLAVTEQGWGDYFAYLLEHRRLERVVGLIRGEPGRAAALVAPLADLETPMAVRIGIGAVIEELAGESLLEAALDGLVAQAGATQPQVRADAVHYLGFVEHPRAVAALRGALEDENPEVREIAGESLEQLSDHG